MESNMCGKLFLLILNMEANNLSINISKALFGLG
jgi:hypothetical protein